jgi:hypothetical protein
MSSESYLTEAEVIAIHALNRDSPYVIKGVSDSQFSPARYYGAMKFNGAGYTYCQNTDEFVRDDVLQFVNKARRAAEKAAKKQTKASGSSQPKLFES